jgi:diguanylate cyclase (GGDEF)-like protein
MSRQGQTGFGPGIMSSTPQPFRPDETWERSLIDMHHVESPLTLGSGMVVAAAVAAVIRGSVGGTGLLAWLLAVELAMASRLAMSWFYLRGGGRQRWSIRRWRGISLAQTGLSGLAWGGLGLFFEQSADPMHRSVILFALMGVCAGRAALTGMMRGSLPLFGLLALGPLSVQLTLRGETADLFLGLALLWYLYLVMVKGPSRTGRAMLALHDERRDRERLVHRLEEAERVGRMGHVLWDHQARVATLSAQARRQFGIDRDHLEDLAPLWARVLESDRARAQTLMTEAMARGQADLHFDTRIDGPDGLRDLRVVHRFEYGADGRTRFTMTTTQDITELKTTQRDLHDLAFRDTLTGLINRAGFQARLREQPVSSVLMLDLDHFKNVNDTLGHAAGDRLLVAAAQRLLHCLRERDTVARLGGDEFAVLTHNALERETLERIAQRIVEALSQPYEIDGQQAFVSASIGIATVGEGQTLSEPELLMRQADTALFEAKARGRARHEFHSESLSARARERLALEADLRRAIAEGQFELHYQPKVGLDDERIVGAEALLRWKHPERGMVPPDRFIPVAEDCGLIVPIGTWVLQQACAAAALWNQSRPAADPLRIAINLSPRQFMNHDLVQTVRDALDASACRPEWIELEITERLLLDERSQAEDILNGLRALGLTLAIDDFGTGYSALGYLTRYPIGTLKIDKSFMRDITTRTDRAGIVRAIILMGHSLKLGLVAEGVETEEQAAFLREQGCELAQGWLYGRPMPLTAFGEHVAARPARAAPAPLLTA